MVRDIKAAQKQTVLGFFWIILSPLLSVAAMTVVFDRMLRVPSDGFPYPIFLFAGQFLWAQFSGALSGATNSVVTNTGFIQKVYIPRLFFPISASLSGLRNICIVFPALLIAMLFMGWHATDPCSLHPLPWSSDASSPDSDRWCVAIELTRGWRE